jgi:hypothetical protein
LKRVQRQHAAAVLAYCEAAGHFTRLSVLEGIRLSLQGLATTAGLLQLPEEANWLATVGAHWSDGMADQLMPQVMEVAGCLLSRSAGS